jgi:hypothetical protein
MKIIDLHCDTIGRLLETQEGLFQNQGHFDLQRAQKAGLVLQFFSLFLYPDEHSQALKGILQQIDRFYEEIEQQSESVYPLLFIKDYQPHEHRLAALLHLEGAECLGTEIEYLRIMYRLGLRSVGLTWNDRNLLADGVKEGPNDGGLSQAGCRMVREMRKMGMLLDLSPAPTIQSILLYLPYGSTVNSLIPAKKHKPPGDGLCFFPLFFHFVQVLPSATVDSPGSITQLVTYISSHIIINIGIQMIEQQEKCP